MVWCLVCRACVSVIVIECVSLGISTPNPSLHWGLPLDYSLALCAPAWLSDIVQKLCVHYGSIQSQGPIENDTGNANTCLHTAGLATLLTMFDCNKEGLLTLSSSPSQQQAFINSEKQVSSGCVHSIKTEAASTEVVNAKGTPVFDAPMQQQLLWHRRCAHADSERINNSVSITHGLKHVQTNKLCQCCVYSKQAAKQLPPAPVVLCAAHEPLAQVSVNIMQFSCLSLQGSKYLCVFVDTSA